MIFDNKIETLFSEEKFPLLFAALKNAKPGSAIFDELIALVSACSPKTDGKGLGENPNVDESDFEAIKACWIAMRNAQAAASVRLRHDEKLDEIGFSSEQGAVSLPDDPEADALFSSHFDVALKASELFAQYCLRYGLCPRTVDRVFNLISTTTISPETTTVSQFMSSVDMIDEIQMEKPFQCARLRSR